MTESDCDELTKTDKRYGIIVIQSHQITDCLVHIVVYHGSVVQMWISGFLNYIELIEYTGIIGARNQYENAQGCITRFFNKKIQKLKRESYRLRQLHPTNANKDRE